MRPQPLPHSFKWNDGRLDAELKMFCLNDMGNGEAWLTPIKLVVVVLIPIFVVVNDKWEKNYELGTPYALRAPEIILRAGYDSKLDIWAVGCLVSNLGFHCQVTI
jgi:serine/threonine-protein kinase SRPK3